MEEGERKKTGPTWNQLRKKATTIAEIHRTLSDTCLIVNYHILRNKKIGELTWCRIHLGKRKSKLFNFGKTSACSHKQGGGGIMYSKPPRKFIFFSPKKNAQEILRKTKKREKKKRENSTRSARFRIFIFSKRKNIANKERKEGTAFAKLGGVKVAVYVC